MNTNLVFDLKTIRTFNPKDRTLSILIIGLSVEDAYKYKTVHVLYKLAENARRSINRVKSICKRYNYGFAKISDYEIGVNNTVFSFVPDDIKGRQNSNIILFD